MNQATPEESGGGVLAIQAADATGEAGNMSAGTAGCGSGWCWRRWRHAGRRRWQRYRGEKQHDHHDDGKHDGEGEYERDLIDEESRWSHVRRRIVDPNRFDYKLSSFVSASPEAFGAAAQDLTDIGSAIRSANTAAEVSALVYYVAGIKEPQGAG